MVHASLVYTKRRQSELHREKEEGEEEGQWRVRRKRLRKRETERETRESQAERIAGNARQVKREGLHGGVGLPGLDTPVLLYKAGPGTFETEFAKKAYSLLLHLVTLGH